MPLTIRILVMCMLLCGSFAFFIFLSNVAAVVLGLHSETSINGVNGPGQWSFENITQFLPGPSNRLYRQHIYSKAVRHHSRHLHAPRKYRVRHEHHSRTYQFKRVCYLTVPSDDWPIMSIYSLDPTLCTHIIIGFAKVSQTGELAPINPDDELFYKDVVALKKQFPELKVLLSIGGGSADLGLMTIIKTPEKRELFAYKSAAYLEKFGLDGLDLDWEFPAWNRPFEERFLFIMLLQQLSRVYHNSVYHMLLTAAVAAPKSIIDRSYRVAEMAHHLDFVSIMGYDMHAFKWYLPFTGHNSPLYQRHDEWPMFATLNLNWTSYYWVQLGMPKEKIVIGLPTYGHTYQLYNQELHGVYSPAMGVGTIGSGGYIDYPSVCRALAMGAQSQFDEDCRVPYAYWKRNWISYDDERSLEEKGRWIRQNHFGGAMIFDLNSDDHDCVCSNTTFPLVRAVRRGLTFD